MGWHRCLLGAQHAATRKQQQASSNKQQPSMALGQTAWQYAFPLTPLQRHAATSNPGASHPECLQ